MEKERKLICVDDLRKTKEHFVLVGARAGKMKVLLESMIEQLIKETPAIDAVEVVHAWWEVVEPKRFPNLTAKIRCSACKKEPKKHSYEESGFGYSYTIDSWHATDYCPNCGAKMDGDGNVGMA